MDFRDAFVVPAAPERVWIAMFDPDVMREVLPGCRRLEAVGPNRFDVTLAAGIGALRGVFNGDVRFDDLIAPAGCTMAIGARSSLGRVTGTGQIALSPVAGGTSLEYQATFTFAGPMVGLGEPLMRSVANTLTRDAMARFCAIVAAEGDERTGE